MNVLEKMRTRLEEMESADLRRHPVELDSSAGGRVSLGGREVICLCSNDYLGLASDPEVIEAFVEAARVWGIGSGASRLVCGTMLPHKSLERAIAEFKGSEDAMLTSTGWMANHAAVCGLAGKRDLVLCDKLDHASILDATLASGARIKRYAHCDVSSLENMLNRYRSDFDRCLIVTDSLFSMDGDMAPLPEIIELKKRFDAMLIIDEAHATGVFGPGGRGVAEYLGVEDSIDLAVGTLSKAIGCLGGYVSGAGTFCEYLRNTARSYIYTTALPPSICRAAEKSLEIIRRRSVDRRRLLDRARDLREKLSAEGFDTGTSVSQIIPVVIGPAEKAAATSRHLLEEGFLVPAIRPPSVPRNTSRLRISLSAVHDEEDLAGLPAALGRAMS